VGKTVWKDKIEFKGNFEGYVEKLRFPVMDQKVLFKEV
jgi:hypothetical protein